MATVIIGAMRVKNEKRIEEAVASLLPLCSRVLVLDDHSDDDTPDRADIKPGTVTVIRSTLPPTLDEARDKNFLLDRIHELDPDWVIWIDGDEVLCDHEQLVLAMTASRTRHAQSFSLKICYLWDNAEHMRIDGIYGRFHRGSVFRVRGCSRAKFSSTGNGGNFHCGNVPKVRLSSAIKLSVRVKHYGYMEPAERQRKFEWYNKIDPNNHHEDGYKHIIGRPSRHAPGPVRLVPWIE